jgi:hypothetical protein
LNILKEYEASETEPVSKKGMGSTYLFGSSAFSPEDEKDPVSEMCSFRMLGNRQSPDTQYSQVYYTIIRNFFIIKVKEKVKLSL